MSTCANCDTGFTTEDFIVVCNVCNDLYHANNCSGCSASELRVLDFKKKKPMLVYRCQACTASGGEDSSLKEVVAELQQSLKWLSSFKEDIKEIKSIIPELQFEVDSMKKDLVEQKNNILKVENTVKNLPVPNLEVDKMEINADFQSMISEIGDRSVRSKNVLIWNLQDSPTTTPTTDSIAVANTLFKIKNIKTVISKLNVKRLGKYDQNKCRPILVRMDSHLDVSTVLINWKEIPSGINVSADLTRFQRSQYKKLKEEANAFNAQHKSDAVKKVVKMVNGNPRIFTVKNRIKNAATFDIVTLDVDSVRASKN